MLRESLILVLCTIHGGLASELHEYDSHTSPIEYLYLERHGKPEFWPTVTPPIYGELPENAKIIRNREVTVLRPITITRDGETGLLFTIESPSNGAHLYLCNEGGLVATWFKFEFDEDETLLTIRLGNTNRPYVDTDVDIITSVYFSSDADRLAATPGVCAGFLRHSVPATVREITDMMNQENRKKKSALLSVDWISNLFINEHPRLLDDESDCESEVINENDETYDETVVTYLYKPIVMNTNVLEKLLELKDHIQE